MEDKYYLCDFPSDQDKVILKPSKGMTKEMIYSANRLNPPERIAEGEYEGFAYYVLNFGLHPCAYIDVSNTVLRGMDYDDIDIECHCGLTYANSYLLTVEKKGWFIGWDYAHYCDFAGYELAYSVGLRTNGKMWTTEEMVEECKTVIDQIKEKYMGDHLYEDGDRGID